MGILWNGTSKYDCLFAWLIVYYIPLFQVITLSNLQIGHENHIVRDSYNMDGMIFLVSFSPDRYHTFSFERAVITMPVKPSYALLT